MIVLFVVLVLFVVIVHAIVNTDAVNRPVIGAIDITDNTMEKNSTTLGDSSLQAKGSKALRLHQRWPNRAIDKATLPIAERPEPNRLKTALPSGK